MDGEDRIEPSRLLIPALAPLYDAGAPYAYAAMRFFTGAVLVPHGWQKLIHAGGGSVAFVRMGLPFPAAWAWAVTGVEFFCALMLAIGLFTRFAAAAITVEMLVITVFILSPNGYFWTQRGYEYALLWALLSIAIFFRGGGRWSVDHYLDKEL